MTKRSTAHRSWRFAALVLVSLTFLPTDAFAWNPLVLNGRCAEKSNQCDSTVGNAGGAGACCDPANPRANGYSSVADCANRNACSGGAPYKWKTIPLTWYWNPNNRPGGFQRRTEAQYATALQEAVDAWSKPTCTSFKATYGGIRTNLTPSTRDGTVVLYFPTQAEWAQFGAGNSTLAFARPIPSNAQADLGDGDVLFNPNLSWGADNVQNNEYDITSVASHEFGHAIGLGHSQFSSALMYYATSGNGPLWANTYRRNLPADDVTAICSTYPRLNCTQQSDCSGCFTCNTASKTCEPRQVAAATGLCKPCSKPADCGGAADICIRTADGNRCAQACDKDECCPTGYRCSDVGGGQKQCVHTSGSCPAISCTTNANCGPGESCQSGTCKPQPVALDTNACKACSNGQCAGTNKCFDLRGDSRCLQPCAADLFCPTGFDCQSTASGRVCVPENLICPCGVDADCPSGQVCRNKFCQKPSGGTFGDPCGDQQPCATGLDCTPTQSGNVCIQFCGQSASSAPAGAPGSTCTGAGGCSNGARCFQAGSDTVCMNTCTSNTNCTSGAGGQCIQVGNVGACLCSQDSQCKSGFTCNKATLTKLFNKASVLVHLRAALCLASQVRLAKTRKIHRRLVLHKAKTVSAIQREPKGRAKRVHKINPAKTVSSASVSEPTAFSVWNPAKMDNPASANLAEAAPSPHKAEPTFAVVPTRLLALRDNAATLPLEPQDTAWPKTPTLVEMEPVKGRSVKTARLAPKTAPAQGAVSASTTFVKIHPKTAETTPVTQVKTAKTARAIASVRQDKTVRQVFAKPLSKTAETVLVKPTKAKTAEHALQTALAQAVKPAKTTPVSFRKAAEMAHVTTAKPADLALPIANAPRVSLAKTTLAPRSPKAAEMAHVITVKPAVLALRIANAPAVSPAKTTLAPPPNRLSPAPSKNRSKNVMSKAKTAKPFASNPKQVAPVTLTHKTPSNSPSLRSL